MDVALMFILGLHVAREINMLFEMFSPLLGCVLPLRLCTVYSDAQQSRKGIRLNGRNWAFQ